MPDIIREDNGDFELVSKWGSISLSSTSLARQIWVIFHSQDEIDENEAFYDVEFVISGFVEMNAVKDRLEKEIGDFADTHTDIIDGGVFQSQLLKYLREQGYEVDAKEFEEWYSSTMES